MDELNNIYVNTGGVDTDEIIFQYFYKTSNIQYFMIPMSVNQLTFYCWGAGGASKLLSIDGNDKSYPFLLNSQMGIVVRPVVWYKFDTNMTIDNSGNNFHMTNVNGVVDTNEYRRGNNSILFKNNGYCVIPNKFELNHINLLQGISIIFWVRLDTSSNANAKIIEFGRKDKFICIMRNGNRLKFQIVDETNDISYVTPENINYFDNRWIYITWMIDNLGNWYIYINNEKMSYNDKNCVIPLFKVDFVYTIGKWMTGNIDDFRIYDKLLSEIEIRLMYEGSMSNSIIGLGGTGGFVKGTLTNVKDFIGIYGNRLRIIVGEGGKNNENVAYLGGGIGKNAGGGGGLSGVFTDNEVLPMPLLVAGGGGGGGGELNKKMMDVSYAKIIMIDGTNDAYVSTNNVIRKFPSRQWDSLGNKSMYVFNGKNCYKNELRYSDDGNYEIYYTQNNIITTNNYIEGIFNIIDNETDGRFGVTYNNTNGKYIESSYLVSSDYMGEWVVIKMSKPMVMTSYKIKRFVDPRVRSIANKAPMIFRLYASVDGISWTILDNVGNAKYDNDNYYNKTLTTDVVYTYFGIVVNRIFMKNDGIMKLYKWEIYGYEMSRINNFVNNNIASYNTYYGGNGGGENGKDGNGNDDINGKGGKMTLGGEGGESFMKNEINKGNNYLGGSGYVNQAGGGSGNYGGGSSGNRYENGRVVAIGGGGGGSSYVGVDVFSFSKDTVMNIGNERNGMIKAPMSNHDYYLKGVGEAGEDGLVVIEYRRNRIINTSIENINKCNYAFIKHPNIIINANDVSSINTSNLLEGENMIYSQTFKGIKVSYSSYKDERNTPINLFDGNYKTNAYFGVEAKNGYNINTGEYMGTNRFIDEDINTNGEWIMIKLDNRIRLRKYEFVINLENLLNTMAAGKWKLYGKNEENKFILLDEMNIRLTTNNINDDYYKMDINNRDIHIYSKNICDNELESDTYLLIVNALAMMGKLSNRAKMCYLGFSEFRLYDGITTTIMSTGRINSQNNDITLVTR